MEANTELRGDAAATALAGKTIERIERDMYRTSMTVHFTDGTLAHFAAGRDSIHNDSWGTVELSVQR
jgi:hypothetical protein